MVRRINQKATERELQIKVALAGLADGTYRSRDHAVQELGVNRSTLYRRSGGGKSRSQRGETRQLLTNQEEKALAEWISTSTATGNPVRHSFIREVAEKLRQRHVLSQPGYTTPIGTTWIPQFLRRHPHLKTKLSRAIEAARIKTVTAEQVRHFNQEFRRIITEHKIDLGNIYNADETGFYLLSLTNYRMFYRYSSSRECCD